MDELIKIEFNENTAISNYLKKVLEIIKKDNDEFKLDKETYFSIYNKYIHISSDYNINALTKSKGEESLQYFYINRPTKDRVRIGNTNVRCAYK